MSRISLFLLVIIAPTLLSAEKTWFLNTSNTYKLHEYQHLFAKYGDRVEATELDLDEIDADPVSVVVHKASQMEDGVLVDDTSLEVDGADIGVKIRWMQDYLKYCIGRRACWKVLLARKRGENVYVYQGTIHGTIVQPRGEGGHCFDSFLQPDGTDKTLAEDRPDSVSARALAVEAFVREEPCAVVSTINSWEGPWQHSDDLCIVSGY